MENEIINFKDIKPIQNALEDSDITKPDENREWSHVPNPTDSSDEDFEAWVTKASLGEVCSVHNLLSVYWNRLVDVKKDMVENYNNSASTQRSEVAEVLKRDIYPMLNRIEQRIFKCKDRIKALDPANASL